MCLLDVAEVVADVTDVCVGGPSSEDLYSMVQNALAGSGGSSSNAERVTGV